MSLGARGQILYKWLDESDSHECIQFWKTKSQFKPSFPDVIINLLVQNIIDSLEMHDHSLEFCTEIKWNNILYWCHPNYRGNGAWEDWVNVLWDTNNEKVFIPAQIKLFFFAIENNVEKLKVLIHFCEEPPRKYWVLTKQAVNHWKIIYVFFLMKVNQE